MNVLNETEFCQKKVGDSQEIKVAANLEQRDGLGSYHRLPHGGIEEEQMMKMRSAVLLIILSLVPDVVLEILFLRCSYEDSVEVWLWWADYIGFCSIIFDRLGDGGRTYQHATPMHLAYYAEDGLSTMVFAYRKIKDSKYECRMGHLLPNGSSVSHISAMIVYYVERNGSNEDDDFLKSVTRVDQLKDLAIDIVRSDNENPTHDRDRKEILEAFAASGNFAKELESKAVEIISIRANGIQKLGCSCYSRRLLTVSKHGKRWSWKLCNGYAQQYGTPISLAATPALQPAGKGIGSTIGKPFHYKCVEYLNFIGLSEASWLKSLLCRPSPVDIGRCRCAIVKENSLDGLTGQSLYTLYTNSFTTSLDLVPKKIHERSPIFLGSYDDVEEIKALYAAEEKA
ncbi:P-type ATPase, HAD-like domain protein [Artemisia annua]|uniref:P-type ATPase, HAD-like domain protein n=1 Tax=Artemisia annua TaxID=35608 RepID=A0A2U1M484_ARTAN|nr:P-type ATPase, HAD-like domain protein [Artemisia annua]